MEREGRGGATTRDGRDESIDGWMDESMNGSIDVCTAR